METEIAKVASEITKEFEVPGQEDEVDSPSSVLGSSVNASGVAASEPVDTYNAFEFCPGCGLRLEQFDEETINLCIIVLSTFVHRYPAVSTPWLLKILLCVGRLVVIVVSWVIYDLALEFQISKSYTYIFGNSL